MAIVNRAEKFVPNDRQDLYYQDWFTNILFETDTKSVSLLKNEEAVKQSIVNIILTNVGERVFNPTFGSEINRMLFENITPQTTSTLIELIKMTIENFEPRAKLLDVIASPLEDNNAYAVSIVFSLINKTEPITLEFLLNRVR